MSSTTSSGQASRFASPLDSKPSGASAESTSSNLESSDLGNAGLNELRRELARLKDTIARLASDAGGEAVKTVRSVSQTVASQVGSAAGGVADAGSELASSAKEHAKTFASELEAMARRNPLGTIAGALLVGVIIGMISRGRS
jgi:ElaB/YqjD/DUF883 family membrane-anchored ribosome-binding protein